MKKMLAVVAAASLVAVAAPAFAANPFSDVPMNHWAYDAVEQLAAKGILEGYPNGTFKGNRAMTRYEIAQMVARMMANGVGGADADKLKALIVEFAPELEALGVKVDGFDGRLSKLEKGVGGLKVWGQMRFDVYHHDDTGDDKSGWHGNGTGMNRGRIFMQKDVGNGVTWDMRWHNDKIDRYFVTAKDFLGAKGLRFRAGQYALDLEGRDNLYKTNNFQDDDAFFLDTSVRGVQLNYTRGAFEIEGNYWSNQGAGNRPVKTVPGNAGSGGVYADNAGNENYAARIAYNGEKFKVSANALWVNPNGLYADNWKMYYFALGLKLIKGLDLTGAYFMEKDIADDPKAWKVVLDVDQSLLKFTSLRFEYAKFDEGFFVQTGPMSWHSNMDYNGWGQLAEDTKYMKIEALQKWGSAGKFQTYERWSQVDANEKAKELQLGIGYQYTPNLWFGLDYTKCDGQFSGGYVVDPNAEDKVVRFRTILNF
jgi:hypothetical protein